MMSGIADYEFVQLLGEGSHGSCWMARCPARLGLDVDHVSVKTLVHNATDVDFERLSTELRHYSSVPSPELVPLYDVGQQGGMLYYAGQYFPDGSLAQPARPFSRAAVLSALSDAALAAHALHEAGLAHRSIKPGNVLIDGDRAKLGDIGLSHVLKPGQTVTGLDHIGSIEYLAPELIQGQAASRATDIWALGATMHKVLTGRPIYPDVPDGSLL
ncbi:MAG: protein kinase, partial [Acidimicrobiia bacterium]|nr:protein kinase [Acidimicrobiia bacterium]